MVSDELMGSFFTSKECFSNVKQRYGRILHIAHRWQGRNVGMLFALLQSRSNRYDEGAEEKNTLN
jgi:hypothetical protein